MKTILEKIISEDSTYNKSATRYLYKAHPDLWEDVKLATSFLPADAKPKQRIWHILNDKYDIEVCPITGEALRWVEKDYRRFSSIEAKNSAIGDIISKATTGNHWRQKDPEKSKKANNKFSDGLKSGNHKPWEERNRDYKTSLAAARKTWMEKYGVDNPSKCPKIQQKLSEAATKRYSGVDRTEINQYYKEVKKITKRSWKKYWHLINQSGVTRSPDWHLDHIFSIREGFSNSIPAEIIGHWTNLRIIAREQNSSKGSDCHKTKEQLYEDYYNSLG